MTYLRSLRLVPMLAALASGCLDTATNKDEVLPPLDSDGSPSAGDGDDPPRDGTPTGDGDGDGSPNPGDGSANPGDGTPAGDGDGGGDGTPAESQIAGTRDGCTSYTAVSGDQCYGFYCNITADMIAAELPSSRKCTFSAEESCSGAVSQKVSSCARSVKSNPANAFDSKEVLRGKIQDCVYEDQSLEDTVPEDCLGCYLDAAQCASDNCLTQCLTGDSAGCDQCRIDNNCNQPVYACGGLPSPF